MAKKIAEKSLADRLLDVLTTKGSITTIEMYQQFKEYKTNSLPSAIAVLRARGHVVRSEVIGYSKGKHPLVKYTLIRK